MLLRLLPKESVDRIIACLDPKDAEQLRSAAAASSNSAPPLDVQSRVLNAFFQLQRSAARPPEPPGPTRSLARADEYVGAEPGTVEPTADPLAAFASLDIGLLMRALDDEQPGTIAALLVRFDPARASLILKNLSTNRRLDVAIRLNQVAMQPPELIRRMAQAVLDKANQLAAIPPEPSAEDRIRNLAAMLRHLERNDRVEILRAIEQSDPPAAVLINKLMFRFEDLLKIPDRLLQNLLTEVDMKTLACALKGGNDQIAEKVLKNISARARQLLNDEIGLLLSVTKSAVQEAQESIVELIRRFETEGKITVEA